ncbi:MAG TPA: PilZ domain-containing protein [Candidatus Sulfotelmatobacter sp.]|nr:PilZ domain-containing protein [Candidatus Sulfotelmatobacter sp.]
MPSPRSDRRRHVRVPCASAAIISRPPDAPVMGVVVNASLGGVMVRIAPPVDWSIGDSLTITIDADGEPLEARVVATFEDQVSIQFTRGRARLSVDAAGSVITLAAKGSEDPTAAGERIGTPVD